MPSTETLVKPASFFCSLSSQEAGESLLGAAPHVNTWFLLEHYGKWGYKAFAMSNISEEIKSHFNQHLENKPLSRLLLIKKDARSQHSGIVFYAAITDQPQPALYKFHLNAYDDLLNINLAALSSRDPQYTSHLSAKPIFLICSNGLRDKCCAKYGLPIYDALKDRLGESLWQSSHHGGHRFGPNLLCFPHGLSFGRLTLENSPHIIAEYQAGRIHLPNLRGRTAYSNPAQAAEVLLRTSIRDSSLSNLTLESLELQSEDRWLVIFSSTETTVSHHVRLAKHPLGPRLFASCIGDKKVEVSEFRLLDHTTA